MFFLFDIGGTRMRLAASRDGKRFSRILTLSTPKKFEDGMAVFARFAQQATGGTGKKYTTVCGGVPGKLNKNRTALIAAPNLKTWVGKPIKQTLESIFHAPAFLKNDAALAGLGEAARGAGRGQRTVAYITVGTGVGGARIVHGRIDQNTKRRFSPEHQRIEIGNNVCSCGRKGHLEAYVSGGAFRRRYHKHPKFIADERIWKESARMLAIGVYNIIRRWSPDIVVLGGSMILGKPGIPLAEILRQIKKISAARTHTPPIKKAALGDHSGLYGALAYARAHKANRLR